MAIWDVVTRGQDPNMPNEVGFRTEVDGETAWYHVPWMAYDPTAGREFAHGTIATAGSGMGISLSS